MEYQPGYVRLYHSECVFCQNYELSFGGEGKPVSDEGLANIMTRLQNKPGSSA